MPTNYQPIIGETFPISEFWIHFLKCIILKQVLNEDDLANQISLNLIVQKSG